MITFNGQDLFSSGPCTIEVGPTQSRDALTQLPGGIGAALISQGQSPRLLTQVGTLIGDTEPALREQLRAIESAVGADAATLIDEHANTYAGCVMRQFNPGPVKRQGPRYTCSYTLSYLQTSP